MNELEKIEKEFGFTYPAMYKALYADGMLDWNRGWTRQYSWFSEVFPTLLENPPFILLSSDFEICPLEEIISLIKDKPDYWDPKKKLIPFGKTHAGDWYAFYINDQDGDDIPIVQVWRDEENAYYLAKNLEDFTFLSMLEASGYIYTEEGIQDGEAAIEDKIKENILAMLASHKKYLSEKYYKVLEAIYNKRIRADKDDYYGISASEDINKTYKKNTNYSKYWTAFKYQL